MKKTATILSIILFVSIGIFYGQKKKVKETVSILNIEVPVRVFKKGVLIKDLKKEEFRLFVNGKKREITGFRIERKVIESQSIGMESKRSAPPLRYFILAMNITNFSDKIKKGVDHILDKILRPNDVLLVFINNKTELFKNISDKESIREKLYRFIEQESIIARRRMTLYFSQLEGAVDVTKFELSLKGTVGSRNPMSMKNDTRYVSDFLRKYTTLWKDYKGRYLIPDVKSYILLSKHLQKIKREKWVISFFQQEMFPRIILSGELMRILSSLIYKWQASNDIETITFARTISRQLMELKEEMDVAKSFPTDEITKIFTKVGATFHSIFLRSEIESFSKDLEYRKISSDLENNLRSLTKRTGGILVSSENIEDAFNKIVKKEDIFYVLTYEPKENEKLEKLKIKVKRKKCKLEYDDNLRSEFTKKKIVSQFINEGSEIKIENLKFSGKKLSFSIDNFTMKMINKKPFGQISIRIRINNLQDTSIFDKGKTLTATREEFNLKMGFGWLSKGRYEIIVDAKDMLSGKLATEFIQVKVD